jgi:hypothetical protein
MTPINNHPAKATTMTSFLPSQFTFRGDSHQSLIAFAAEIGLAMVLVIGYSAQSASQTSLDASTDPQISCQVG